MFIYTISFRIPSGTRYDLWHFISDIFDVLLLWYTYLLLWCFFHQDVYLSAPSRAILGMHPFRRPPTRIAGCDLISMSGSDHSNLMTRSGLRLAQRLRRWTSIKPTPAQHLTAVDSLSCRGASPKTKHNDGTMLAVVEPTAPLTIFYRVGVMRWLINMVTTMRCENKWRTKCIQTD